MAQVVLFLCSDAASYIIEQGISVDGGYTIHKSVFFLKITLCSILDLKHKVL